MWKWLMQEPIMFVRPGDGTARIAPRLPARPDPLEILVAKAGSHRLAERFSG
jgi:hypothetical protein